MLKHYALARFRSDESGQTLVLAAVCLVVLVGMLALSVDAGMLRYKKRQMQSLADASALAGALELSACAGTASCSSMQTAAKTALMENGFSSTLLQNCAASSGTTLQLTLNNPPCAISSDPNAGNSRYIETVVSQSVPTVFAQVLGVKSVNVAARAEATKPPSPCVYLLSQNSTQPSLSLTNQTINTSCPYYLGLSYSFNSGSSSTGSPYYVAGRSSSSTGFVSPAATFNFSAMSDPLRGLVVPSYSSCTYRGLSIAKAANLQPGIYCGGLTISTSSTVALASGTYIIVGPLLIDGPTLTGSGVTFYVTGNSTYSYGASSIKNANVTLTAPTFGSLQGILYFSDPGLPVGTTSLSLANWNESSRLDGILYLPGQELIASNVTLEGKKYFGVVADYCAINNSGFYPSDDYSSLANGTPFTSVNTAAAIVQ
jgi:Flp pilus assembly protein TadG